MLNLTEILKNAPKGLKLWSPLFGEVILNSTSSGIIHVTIEHDGILKVFCANGKYFDYPDAECLLFPSKEHRTWDNWQQILFKKGDYI